MEMLSVVHPAHVFESSPLILPGTTEENLPSVTIAFAADIQKTVSWVSGRHGGPWRQRRHSYGHGPPGHWDRPSGRLFGMLLGLSWYCNNVALKEKV
jgi:hypothetical protein